MKVLIDTNVLISAVWRDRGPEAVILWVLGEADWEWIVSPEILHISGLRTRQRRRLFGYGGCRF